MSCQKSKQTLNASLFPHLLIKNLLNFYNDKILIKNNAVVNKNIFTFEILNISLLPLNKNGIIFSCTQEYYIYIQIFQRQTESLYEIEI